MPCYSPLKAFRTPHGSDKAFTFNPVQALNSTNPISLPCGNCIGCRADTAEQWAVRCAHECQMHEASSFITLTYSDEYLPSDYSLSKPVFQNFMKRLRFDLAGKVRFFAAGEYGEQNFRPHYHALIFGWDFHADRKLWKNTKDGPLWTSEQLTRLWPFGFSTLGQANYKTANYCTQYMFDKRGGAQATDRYLRTHPISQEIVRVEPEFSLKSTRPGLGSTWFDKFKSDVFPSDFLIVEGRHVQVPRYYQLKLTEEERLKIEKQRLRKRHPERRWNKTPERLKVRHFIHASRVNTRKPKL